MIVVKLQMQNKEEKQIRMKLEKRLSRTNTYLSKVLYQLCENDYKPLWPIYLIKIQNQTQLGIGMKKYLSL